MGPNDTTQDVDPSYQALLADVRSMRPQEDSSLGSQAATEDSSLGSQAATEDVDPSYQALLADVRSMRPQEGEPSPNPMLERADHSPNPMLERADLSSGNGRRQGAGTGPELTADDKDAFEAPYIEGGVTFHPPGTEPLEGYVVLNPESASLVGGYETGSQAGSDEFMAHLAAWDLEIHVQDAGPLDVISMFAWEDGVTPVKALVEIYKKWSTVGGALKDETDRKLLWDEVGKPLLKELVYLAKSGFSTLPLMAIRAGRGEPVDLAHMFGSGYGTEGVVPRKTAEGNEDFVEPFADATPLFYAIARHWAKVYNPLGLWNPQRRALLQHYMRNHPDEMFLDLISVALIARGGVMSGMSSASAARALSIAAKLSSKGAKLVSTGLDVASDLAKTSARRPVSVDLNRWVKNMPDEMFLDLSQDPRVPKNTNKLINELTNTVDEPLSKVLKTGADRIAMTNMITESSAGKFLRTLELIDQYADPLAAAVTLTAKGVGAAAGPLTKRIGRNIAAEHARHASSLAQAAERRRVWQMRGRNTDPATVEKPDPNPMSQGVRLENHITYQEAMHKQFGTPHKEGDNKFVPDAVNTIETSKGADRVLDMVSLIQDGPDMTGSQAQANLRQMYRSISGPGKTGLFGFLKDNDMATAARELQPSSRPAQQAGEIVRDIERVRDGIGSAHSVSEIAHAHREGLDQVSASFGKVYEDVYSFLVREVPLVDNPAKNVAVGQHPVPNKATMGYLNGRLLPTGPHNTGEVEGVLGSQVSQDVAKQVVASAAPNGVVPPDIVALLKEVSDVLEEGATFKALDMTVKAAAGGAAGPASLRQVYREFEEAVKKASTPRKLREELQKVREKTGTPGWAPMSQLETMLQQWGPGRDFTVDELKKMRTGISGHIKLLRSGKAKTTTPIEFWEGFREALGVDLVEGLNAIEDGLGRELGEANTAYSAVKSTFEDSVFEGYMKLSDEKIVDEVRKMFTGASEGSMVGNLSPDDIVSLLSVMEPAQRQAFQLTFLDMLLDTYGPIGTPTKPQGRGLSDSFGGLRGLSTPDGAEVKLLPSPQRDFAVAILGQDRVDYLVVLDQVSHALRTADEFGGPNPTDKQKLSVVRPFVDLLSRSRLLRRGPLAVAAGTAGAGAATLASRTFPGEVSFGWQMAAVQAAEPGAVLLGAYLSTRAFNKALSQGIKLHADPHSLFRRVADMMVIPDYKAVYRGATAVPGAVVKSGVRKQSGVASRKWDDANADFQDEDVGNRGPTGHGSHYKN